MALSEALSGEPHWRGPRLNGGVLRPRFAHVPTGVMLDFAFGGLDDELLQALYGGHIGTCASCSRAIMVYRRQRPADPARLYELPEFSPCSLDRATYPLTAEEAGSRFKKYLATGSGPLLIVAGEANPAVYDDRIGDAFRERAREAHRTGVPVPQVICGPAMGLDDRVRAPGDTVLPALAEEGTIRLYITKHRQRLHFRVSGEESAYTEDYHQAGNPGERHGYWYRSRPIANLFRRRFQAILDAKLAHPAKRDDFVFFPMETIRRIQESVGERFDSMTAQELAATEASLG